MMDAAKRRGIEVDLAVLERELGVPVVPTVAVRRDGARELIAKLDAIADALHEPRAHLGAGTALEGDALHAVRITRRRAVCCRSP